MKLIMCHSKSYIKVLSLVLALCLLPFFNFGQSTDATAKLDTFLAIATDLFEKAQLPGAGIAIVNEGKVVYKGGFGYIDVEKQQPVTENSLFFIGSTGKAFTGFAAAKMVDQKQLKWKEPIINYLPDFTLSEPYVAKHVNLEDLFTHMTGLARKDQLWLDESLTREDIYKQATQLEFAHSFRETWDYNNHAYIIIGKVLEQIADDDWESIIQRSIFDPLEMSNSYTLYQDFLSNDEHVTGYQDDGKTVEPHKKIDNIGPAGSITSTPSDISKWLLMLVNKGVYKGKQLISNEQYDYLMGPKGMSFVDTCAVQYYSIGWGGLVSEGKRTLRHSGAITGNSARVSFMPDDGFGIFIMTNQQSDYKAILTDYAESIFVNGGFKRDFSRENQLISQNRFIQFKNLLLDRGVVAAEKYYQSIEYKDFEEKLSKLGYSLLFSGQVDPALLVFRLNKMDHPDSFKAVYNYAYALSKAGKKEEAIKMYKQVLILNPENQSAQDALEKLLND